MKPHYLVALSLTSLFATEVVTAAIDGGLVMSGALTAVVDTKTSVRPSVSLIVPISDRELFDASVVFGLQGSF